MSYLLEQAAWKPIYQARLNEDSFEQAGSKPRVDARIHLEMSARYIQATQELWSKCKADFCLYPPPKKDFPVLNYPTYHPLILIVSTY